MSSFHADGGVDDAPDLLAGDSGAPISYSRAPRRADAVTGNAAPNGGSGAQP